VFFMLQIVAACCSVLQCVAVCFSELQCVAVLCCHYDIVLSQKASLVSAAAILSSRLAPAGAN